MWDKATQDFKHIFLLSFMKILLFYVVMHYKFKRANLLAGLRVSWAFLLRQAGRKEAQTQQKREIR